MTETEEWRPVVGYEGSYEVSDQGRVRSVDRTAPHPRYPRGTMRLRGRLLRPAKTLGYAFVHLSVGGDRRATKVQWLVAEAFLGQRPEGAVVCHNNGIRDDNRLSNLRYDTPSGNNHDTVRHGNHWQASKTHCKHGHEFTSVNTYLRPEGGRRCRACDTARSRRRHAATNI